MAWHGLAVRGWVLCGTVWLSGTVGRAMAGWGKVGFGKVWPGVERSGKVRLGTVRRGMGGAQYALLIFYWYSGYALDVRTSPVRGIDPALNVTMLFTLT